MICILPIARESYDKACQTEEEEDKYEDTDEDYVKSNSRGERESYTQTPRKCLSRSLSGLQNHSNNNMGRSSSSNSKLDISSTPTGACNKCNLSLSNILCLLALFNVEKLHEFTVKKLYFSTPWKCLHLIYFSSGQLSPSIS